MERKKDSLEHEQKLEIKYNYKTQNHFSNELEFAIVGWQGVMNTKVAKGKKTLKNFKKKRDVCFSHQNNKPPCLI
jgi:hypothetical protein